MPRKRRIIRLNYKKIKVSPGSAVYATSTTADNAAAISGSIDLFKELQRSGYNVGPYAPILDLLEKASQEIYAIKGTVQKAVKESEVHIRTLTKYVERQERATDIIKKMTHANYLFQDRRRAELFKLDKPEILERLRKASVGEDDFVGKIASLASLFEVGLDPLRRLVPKHDPSWKSITLVEKMLESEKIQVDPDMTKIWREIIELRNSTPIHADNPPISTLEFFGVTYPVNYPMLWENVLDKFQYSLNKFVKILFDLPKK